MSQQVSVFVPATVGNVGAGFDVLGLAVDGLGDYFTGSPADKFSIEVNGRDSGVIPTDPELNTVTLAARKFAELFDQGIAFHVKIDRHLPASGGLGASAASSVAGAMIAARFLAKEDEQEAIIAAALHAEGIVAGRHLDNIAPCVYGGLTVVAANDAGGIYSAPVGGVFYIVLITPPIKIKTADAREVLPLQVSREEMVGDLSRVSSLLTGFASYNQELIGLGLKNNFGERYRHQLIPGFKSMQAEMQKLGALGFTISGAGPTCFAVFTAKPRLESIKQLAEEIYGQGTTTHVGTIDQRGAIYL